MFEDVRGRLEGLLHQRQPAAPCTLSTGRGARTVCARRTREPEVAEATRPQHWRDGGGARGEAEPGSERALPTKRRERRRRRRGEESDAARRIES